MHTATMPPVTGEQKPSARAVRDATMAVTADPVLGFEFVKADLGISHATFFRTVRHQLPIIQLSTRRFGVRKSDYDAWKQSRVRPGRA